MANLVKLGTELVKKSPQVEFNIFGYSALLGKIVFAHRIRAGLTQVQLAQLAGVGDKTIHRIEGGSSNVTNKSYESVFAVLKITSKELAEAFAEDAAKKANGERELVPQ